MAAKFKADSRSWSTLDWHLSEVVNEFSAPVEFWKLDAISEGEEGCSKK